MYISMMSANTSQLRKTLNSILNSVEFRNERVTIIRYGKPVAVLVPIASEEVVSDPTTALASAGPAAPVRKIPGKTPGKSPK